MCFDIYHSTKNSGLSGGCRHKATARGEQKHHRGRLWLFLICLGVCHTYVKHYGTIYRAARIASTIS